MTTLLSVLIFTFYAIPCDVSIYIKIEREAQELPDITQYDAPESNNARIRRERTTSVLPLPY